MSLLLDTYTQLFLSMKRGGKNEIVSNAKPAYLLALINYIEDGYIVNDFKCTDINLRKHYDSIFEKYPWEKKAQLNLPYFHLKGKSFYEIKWKSDDRPSPRSHCLPYSYFEKYLDYAKLDDELWNILQDKGNREYLRDAIIKFYFNPQSTQ